MAERYRAAVGVDVSRIVGKSELPRHCQRLRGKGLVQLDRIHLADSQPRQGQCLAAGRNRSDSHDPGFDARGGRRNDTSPRRQSEAPHRLLRGNEKSTGAVIDT